jgi:2-aminoadipate transaminase
MSSLLELPTHLEDLWMARFAHRAVRMTSSSVRELLKVTERPDFISFAGGFPAPELFPIQEISETVTRILQNDGARALQYSATEGFRPLRELIAANMNRQGVPANVDNVLITTGSQQALDLLGKVLIDEGDPVLVEAPTYLATLQAWSVYGAQFNCVNTDQKGFDAADLAGKINLRTKLVYCIPNFQNPSGATMPIERRERLIKEAARYNLPIVEDDPYRELRFEGQPVPRLIELESALNQTRNDGYTGNVIYLTTYSKVLAPGLRVGSIVAAAPLIRKLVQSKQSSDLHTPTLNQMIAYELDRQGFLESQAQRVARSYKERRDVMMQAIHEHFPCEVQMTRPEGGMFLWLQLPNTIDTSLLLQRALDMKVAFVPGESFYANGLGQNCLRLNFSNASLDKIREGIARLGQALRAML